MKINKMAIKKQVIPWLLVAPGIILIFLYLAYPIIENIRMSFLNYKLYERDNIYFNNFENYRQIFKADPNIPKVFKNALIWTGSVVTGQFVFGMILANLLNRKFKARGLVQSIVFVPWAVSGFLVGFMFRWIFAQNNGILNYVLMSLGLIEKNIVWLGDKNLVLIGPIVAQIWAGIPFFGIMILAALQSVPQEVLESAQVDGAKAWQRFRFITFPYIRHTVITTILLRIIWTFGASDVIYSMTDGGPNYASSILTLYSYNQAFSSMDFGYAAALSNVITIIMLCFSLIYLAVTKFSKEVSE